eukprot:m.69978 g.69978  ORF g.69978 m.69978 type:complete len:793 (+) comp8294_c0_seq3:92-2470(+)
MEEQHHWKKKQQKQLAPEDDEEVLETFTNQESLKPFFEESFDENAYVTSIVSVKLITNQLERLQVGIDAIQKELNTQVANRHADLITQATGIQKLEDVLVMITSRVTTLHKNVARIKTKVMEPYEKIVALSNKLVRMQTACELLRRANKFVSLITKLKGHIRGGDNEMIRAAHILFEIQNYMADSRLRGVHVVERQRTFVIEVKEDLERKAREKLRQGLYPLKHQSLTAGLQVFSNLGVLKEEVENLISQKLKSLQVALSSLFTPSIQGRQPHSLTDSEIRAYVWDVINTVLKLFLKISFESRTLHVVMKKKKAQTSYLSFSEIVEPSTGGIAHRVCFDMLSMMKKEFTSTQVNSKAKRVLEANFPKVLHLFTEKWRKISHNFNAETSSQLLRQEGLALRECLRCFEDAYVGGSLSRMFDNVNRMFDGVTFAAPSNEDIMELIKVMNAELLASQTDAPLQFSIVRNILKACESFCLKTKKIVVPDASALAVSMKASVSMKRNISLVNSLFFFSEQFSKAMDGVELSLRIKFSPECRSLLAKAKQRCDDLLLSVFTPLFDSSRVYLLASVSKMHDSPLSVNTSASSDHLNKQCTQFMEELKIDVSHIQEQVFARFECISILQPYVESLMREMMEFYVINICIFDSLDQEDKLTLTADLAQFEIALEPLVQSSFKRPQELGAQYKMLRAVRLVLFKEPSEIIANTLDLPKSFMLHYLFSQTDREMASPRMCDGSDYFDYGNWMLQNSEEKRLESSHLALSKYGRKQSSRGGSYQQHPLYPLLLSFHASATSNNK